MCLLFNEIAGAFIRCWKLQAFLAVRARGEDAYAYFLMNSGICNIVFLLI